MMLFQRPFLSMIGALLFCLANITWAGKIRSGAADPSAMKFQGTYYSVEASGGGIVVRAASSIEGLGASDARQDKVWSNPDNLPSIWAPQITTDLGRTFIHFSAGNDKAHRMYVISADTPLGSPYSTASKVDLPNDKWAIDGTFFVFEGLGYMVWSGWEADENIEQNLYICRMDSPSKAIGERFIISQPREGFEDNDEPLINEGPEAIVDPNGQLHIVYSANGSWGPKYCLVDLRLRKGGNPTFVWDWYKSNGCLFGSVGENMMNGWDVTTSVNGPGHHTFALEDGDAESSPPEGPNHIPMLYHAVDKGVEYNWTNRNWYAGSFVWWSKTTYSRKSVPGDNSNTGFSFKFFES